ncbi:uncharacterized protein LOC116190089 [Punica granatum]|uniref:Uncharacterized protein LOC116190089 n=1 Tax=Punica granatum TaxID=22663 RepID=A0A6P8C2K8_PUNGR|nr:uncharacterized protein LOC116190089 [Punica granatum]
MVEQVDEENVVQVVTNNASHYKATCEMLMEKRKKLFWTPYTAHCIDLILEDLEKKIKVHELTIMKSRKITTFIYSRTLLIMMLKHFTKSKELIRPVVTRFATAYLTLGCLFDNRNALRTIYDPVWKVIDERWEVQLHRPLHAAAYYLNLQLHFSSKFSADREVIHGLYKVMDQMLDDEERDKVDLQLEEFKHERWLFGFSSAKSMRFKKTPADWWESYGADTPELQRFSIRILSLTCSSSGCEHNWSAFEMLKDKKIMKQVDLQVEEISSDDEWIVEEEKENTATLSHNFNLRSLGRGDDGDEESGDIQIGDADAENMHTQEHGTVDDLELPKEDEFDTLYNDDVGDDEDLDEI